MNVFVSTLLPPTPHSLLAAPVTVNAIIIIKKNIEKQLWDKKGTH